MISFDMHEAVIKSIVHSQIRTLNALFKKMRPDYKLVDYGPLVMNDSSKE